MKNKLLVVSAIVIGVLFLGFDIVVTLNNKVLMDGFIAGQKELSDSQGRIERRLARLENSVRGMGAGQQQLPSAQPRAQRPSEDMNKVYDIPVGDSAILGAKDAAVTIAMFNDFQCPYCGQFYPAAREALKAYPKDARFVLKHYPLPSHSMARPAAKAALAAGVQGKFYEMADLLFQNNSLLSEDKFKELAGKLGLNVEQFLRDYKDRDAEWEKVIADDMKIAAEAGVRGTPTFFINGRKTKARAADEWKQAIDAAFVGGGEKSK